MTQRIHHRFLLHALPALLSGHSSQNQSQSAPAAQEEVGKGCALATALARAQQEPSVSPQLKRKNRERISICPLKLRRDQFVFEQVFLHTSLYYLKVGDLAIKQPSDE